MVGAVILLTNYLNKKIEEKTLTQELLDKVLKLANELKIDDAGMGVLVQYSQYIKLGEES